MTTITLVFLLSLAVRSAQGQKNGYETLKIQLEVQEMKYEALQDEYATLKAETRKILQGFGQLQQEITRLQVYFCAFLICTFSMHLQMHVLHAKNMPHVTTG